MIFDPDLEGGQVGDGGVDDYTPPSEFSDIEREIVERSVNDRTFFFEVVLGGEWEDWQKKAADDLDNGETRISIRSGNGVGKTCFVAVIVLHYLLFRNDVKIPVTAPASGQLKDGLIPEVHKWMNLLPEFLKKQLDYTQDRIYRVDSPANNFISFRTARKETPEALQGIHATFVMCAVDEASGVPDAVYEAAAGTMSTPGAIFIMISNPTRLSGYFYNSHHRSKFEWRRHHVSSFDVSRVDQTFVDSIVRAWGERSDQYQVKVLGEFPSKEEESLIGRDVVISAIDRDIACTGDDVVLGVDVGRGGDLSALCARQGNWMFGFATQNYSDTMQTVGWVCEHVEAAGKELKLDAKHGIVIYVDSIGIGAGVADRLREMGYNAVDVNVGEAAAMKNQFVRMRDELWYALKSWFESMNVSVRGLNALQTDMFVDECSTPLQLFTSTGKNGVESKTQMRQRGFASPNMADCACLTFAYDHSIAHGAYGAANDNWDRDVEYDPPACVW